EHARYPLRDLACRVWIAELPVMLGDRFVPPRQHELVAEREVVATPPERPADPQAAIWQRDEDVLVRAPGEVAEAGLELVERQMFQHLERAHGIERQARG